MPEPDSVYSAMASATSIVVLGGGVTGLTVAAELAGHERYRVLLLDKASQLGGLASTFQIEGHTFDTGSHRLHEDYVPAVARLLEDLCGQDLLRRERKGLIYIGGKPLRYPPTVFDILHALAPLDLATAVCDLIRARLSAKRSSPAGDFEKYTTSRVGQLLYSRFYRPYAVKLYGLPPAEIGIEPALTRVRPFRARAIARDLMRHVSGGHRYYRYPRHGIGQIAAELKKRFLARGGEVIHIRSVKLLSPDDGQRIKTVLFHTHEGQERTVTAGTVVSTIPISSLFQLLYPEHSAPEIRWRDLRILYLLCSGQHTAPHETYYCPDSDVIFGRVSDLNKYSPALNASEDTSLFAAEIPCSPGDAICKAGEPELSARCLADLKRLNVVPSTTRLLRSFSRTLSCVYPVYDLHWKERFDHAYNLLDRIENLYMVGRTALFMHCNIDHCMLMALELARHLAHRAEDKRPWAADLARFTAYRIRE